MNNPRVTVLMPVYNGSKYLRESIDSILRQTFTDFEFIIVNDGSTDNSEQVILSYNDPRILYVKNEVNSKICVTLNKGLDLAKGEYIARIDSDDIALPNRLEEQISFLDLHPNIGIVGSDIISFGENFNERYFDFLHDTSLCKAGLLFATCFAHPAVMMRKSILNANGLRYNEQYKGLEDFELWWRLSQYCEMTNLPKPLLRYRIHGGQETQNVSVAVSNKEIEFIADRFRYFIPELTTEDLEVAIAYCTGDWEKFDDVSFLKFIKLGKKIIVSHKVKSSRSFQKAMSITFSKAIALISQHSTRIKNYKCIYFTKSFFYGVMPFNWYLKFTLHSFLR